MNTTSIIRKEETANNKNMQTPAILRSIPSENTKTHENSESQFRIAGSKHNQNTHNVANIKLVNGTSSSSNDRSMSKESWYWADNFGLEEDNIDVRKLFNSQPTKRHKARRA